LKIRFIFYMTDASGLTAEEQAELRKIAVEEGITDTSMPKMETDAEPPIALFPLLNQHSKLIEALRAACQAELNSDPDPQMKTHYNDNLFLLRFLLSAKFKLDKATHAVKTAIAWRNKHRAALGLVRAGKPVPYLAEMRQYMINDFHKSSIFGGPVAILRAGISDPQAVMDRLDMEQVVTAMMLSREVPYLICDEESRKRGYLVKMISVMDMANTSFSRMMNRKWMGHMGQVSKEMELVYPQLLGTSFVVNTPGFFRVVFGIASKLMPQSAVEKMVVCKGDASKNPCVTKVLRLQDLPTFVGGTCRCNAGPGFPNGRCICGIDNDRNIVVTEKPLPLR